MKINGINLQAFNATFVSFVDSPPKIAHEFFVDNLSIQKLYTELTPKTRTLCILFEREEDIGFFNSRIFDAVKIEYEGYLYDGYLSAENPISYEHIGGNIYKASYDFMLIKKKPLRKHIIQKLETVIRVDATWPTSPCRYTVSVKNNSNQILVAGNVIENVKAGDKIVIDGIEKKVTRNGTNDFSNCRLLANEFPFLTIRENNIVVSSISDFDTILEYYPICN